MAGLGVVISAAAREGLEGLLRAGNAAQKIARRARIALLAGEGRSDADISREVGVNRKTAALWRLRIAEPGALELVVEPHPQKPAAEQNTPAEVKTETAAVQPPKAVPSITKSVAVQLRDRRPASGPKKVLTPEVVDRIVRTTLQEKPEGRTHWSTRSLGQHLGLSKMAVQRVWNQQKLQPHRLETFKFSKDKHFVEKLRNVVGIYLTPPPNSVVYCVDEKTGIQALDRTQPGLPWKKGKCGTRTHDYKRHGTTDLFAAYNVGTGEVLGECHPRHSNQEFLCFLRRLDRDTPRGLQVHIILDNASFHSHVNVQRWLKRHRRFHFHFVPTSSSWTNLVERWFGLLTSQCIRRGVFGSLPALQVSITRYMEVYNQAPRPFHWRASVDQILEKIRRAAWKAGVTLPWMSPSLAT
jgi:transposase